MNKFKSLIMSCHGKSKTLLHWLYNTHSDYDEDEKVFEYKELIFWFNGTGFRNTEKLILNIGIPEKLFDMCNRDYSSFDMTVATENFILHLVFPVISELRKEYQNDNKDSREKAQFCTQPPDACMDRKSGCLYNRELKRYVLKIHFNVPLVNAISVNSKAAFRAVKDIMEHIDSCLSNIDMAELVLWQKTFMNQQSIRTYMKENKICAFVADGSILPRRDGSDKPMLGAQPFISPESMRISITTAMNETITGMGIKEGITVITGGGYSGKTTLLRDIARNLSDGFGEFTGINVAVADERGEIGACYRGEVTNDLGRRTDVLDGCPKAEGMLLLLRSMGPGVLLTDEIGSRQDEEAICRALHAGVSVVASAHGRGRADVLRRLPGVGALFSLFVTLRLRDGVHEIEAVEEYEH